MKPFTPATLPKVTAQQLVEDFKITLEQAKEQVERMNLTKVYLNDIYQVNIIPDESYTWLSIKRIDKKSIHDWRHLQEIKNQFLGKEAEAVELYPAESRLVDSANQYHLFSPKIKGFKFPFGFNERLVTYHNIANAVQRPLEQEAEEQPLFTFKEAALLMHALTENLKSVAKSSLIRDNKLKIRDQYDVIFNKLKTIAENENNKLR